MKHLNEKIGEHIGISPLTKKKVKPKGCVVSNHLLLCNHSPSFESFSVLTKGNKKFVLGLKKSLLIMRDKHSLNRDIRLAPSYLTLHTLFSSLSIWLLAFHLEHCYIVHCFNRLTNFLRICWNHLPETSRNKKKRTAQKIKYSCTFLHLIDFKWFKSTFIISKMKKKKKELNEYADVFSVA